MADLKPPALAPARSRGAHLSPWPPPSMHFLAAVSSLSSPVIISPWAEWGAFHPQALGPALGPALGQVARGEPGRAAAFGPQFSSVQLLSRV